MAKLSPKEREFARAYVKLRQGKGAAIEAGYAKGSAEVTGSKLLRKPNVLEEIRRLEGLREKKALMTADEVERELDRLIRFNLRDFVDPKTGDAKPIHELTDDQAACVKEIAVIETQLGTSRNLKFYDKIAAIRVKLERLKLIGEHEPPRVYLFGAVAEPEK